MPCRTNRVAQNGVPRCLLKGHPAVVYKDHMQVLGGGERSALTYAKALQRLGMVVQVVSSTPLPPPERMLSAFGEEFADIPLVQIPREQLDARFEAEPPLVFINYTMNGFVRNPAKVGLYCQMFPTAALCRDSRPREWEILQSYSLILNNSSFTKKYNDHLWEYPPHRSHVLHPALSQLVTERARSLLDCPIRKQQRFVTVGRFNVRWNNKNQKIIIEAFLDAKQRFSDLAPWRLVVIGNKSDDEASREYYDDCSRLGAASGGCIEIMGDLSVGSLKTQLEDAFGYVHAAGAFALPGKTPFSCEHYGRSIVEAMACGCFPIVYARGGIFDVLDVSEVGLPYITREGLVEAFVEAARIWREPGADEVQRKAIRLALETSFDKFVERLGQIICRELQS
jgi:glycosyltransferase involved in cell wall biosynthesis